MLLQQFVETLLKQLSGFGLGNILSAEDGHNS